ncbi:hypothetical protein [Fusobacterium polymorphum]|uniref:hypothetical protein n=1 Tax=Fusobacterium nucleatum subsp. polymorphum TaxID=76857 RepID=UPI00300AAA33
MGFLEGLKNLAQKGFEKMQEMRAEIDEEKLNMYDLTVEELKREANRGKTAHRMAALEILRDNYGIERKREGD